MNFKVSGGEPMRLLVHSAKQVVQVTSEKETILKGGEMRNVKVLCAKPGDGISIVVNRDGLIVAIGFDSEIRQQFREAHFERQIDASEQCVLPGFVDAHTHPVWAGDRIHEFRRKLAGESYMEIHKNGGGIHATVEHTRRASEDSLFRNLRDRLLRMTRSGTTLVECKSGYGLNVDTELTMLRVLERAKRDLTFVDISSTFCGAHAIPKSPKVLTEEEATQAVLNNQLPAVARAIRTGEVSVDNIDVFCEKGVFELESTKKILEAGRALGFRLNFHADEIHALGGAEMGASIRAEVMSHLEKISDKAIVEMASYGGIAVVLPTTAYILRLEPPPVRKMIDAGVPVALGSDFNPNAYCLAMPLVMHLACILFGMSLEEALVAATINAAASLGLSETHGSIETGKKGDLILVDVPTWEHLIYQFGEHDHLIQTVIKDGFVAYDKTGSN